MVLPMVVEATERRLNPEDVEHVPNADARHRQPAAVPQDD